MGQLLHRSKCPKWQMSTTPMSVGWWCPRLSNNRKKPVSTLASTCAQGWSQMRRLSGPTYCSNSTLLTSPKKNCDKSNKGGVKNGVRATTSVTAAGKTAHSLSTIIVGILWYDCTSPSRAQTCRTVLISTRSFRVTSNDQRLPEVIPHERHIC